MSTYSSIKNHCVHLWSVFLPHFITDDKNLLDLLSDDERYRLKRFKIPLHQHRFGIARAFLRKILNLYTEIPPKDIRLIYGEKGKPALEHPIVYFNVSHSHDFAVYAITRNQEIGIDIEKIEEGFKKEIAKRFFTPEEYEKLLDLSESEQIRTFYTLWVRKEAMIKVMGKGLFSSPLLSEPSYYLENIQIDPEYQCAVATIDPILERQDWAWTPDGIIKRDYSLTL